MSDQHQVNSIIATAIIDARKDHPNGEINQEPSKSRKCIHRGTLKRRPSARASQ